MDDTLGTLNQVNLIQNDFYMNFCKSKVLYEVEYTQYSKILTIQTKDNQNIGCIILYHSEESQSHFQPLMIKCNPNAGFMETSALESPWIEYYHNLGINVCLWNYRGFSKTKGAPTPSVLLPIRIFAVM